MNLDTALAVFIPLLIIGILVYVLVWANRKVAQEEKYRQHILRIGKTAKATVLELKQTGASVKVGGERSLEVALQLQVEPEDRPFFAATVKQMVPEVELSQMPRGSVVLVRYNPENPNEIVFFGNLGLLSNVVQSGDYETKTALDLVVQWQILDHDLTWHGQKTSARIITTEKTGITLYGGAVEVARFTLDVTPPYGSPFRAESVQFIKQASWHKFQPGTAVTVHYDPKQPEKVVFEARTSET